MAYQPSGVTSARENQQRDVMARVAWQHGVARASAWRALPHQHGKINALAKTISNARSESGMAATQSRHGIKQRNQKKWRRIISMA